MEVSVTLREKSISKGRKSLYLDFYPPIQKTGSEELTRREFLKRYIYEKPKSTSEKEHNKKQLSIASKIRQERKNELDKYEIYSAMELEYLRIKQQGERCFVAYFRELANKRKSSNYDNWVSALNHFVAFTGGSLKFSDLSVELMTDFKKYLLTAKSNRSDKEMISQNTASSYFKKIKAVLKQAYSDGLIQKDLNASLASIKELETHREVLSVTELNQLIKTPSRYEVQKKAALFSVLTGLRFVDIQNLTWGNIKYIEGEGYSVYFIQKKTKGVEKLPINEQAYSLLGEVRSENEKVFEGLVYSGHKNKILKEWIKNAGITKEITFHCFRHTFATLQITEGTEIYTVSKMLGHKNFKTTQIYAKVVDKLTREASDKIKLDF